MLVIGVLGAGAIGGYVGCQLHGNCKDVKVILVGRKRLKEEVEKKKNVVKSINVQGNATVCDDIQVSDNIEDLKSCDVILISLKSGLTESVSKDLYQKVLEKSEKKIVIISLQNGVTNPDVIRKAIGGENNHEVLPGMVEFNSIWEGDATYRQTTGGAIFFQTSNIEAGKQFAKLGKDAGLNFVVEDDITPYQYGKLVINLNNAVNALSGVPILTMFKDKNFRKIIATSMREAIDVFQKSGIPLKTTKAPVSLIPRLFTLPNFMFNIIQPIMIKIDKDAKTSMLQDLEGNKLTEIDYLNGVVVQVAKANNLPIPKYNQTIVQLIHEAENEKKIWKGKDLYERLS